MPKIIITETPEKWNLNFEGVSVITPSEYFDKPEYQDAKRHKIINLCKSHQYQSIGYYVSMLAEARGHKVLPEIGTLQGFRFRSLIKDDAEDFEDIINESLKGINENELKLNVFLGHVSDVQFSRLGILLNTFSSWESQTSA